jgi:hypothetical protein
MTPPRFPAAGRNLRLEFSTEDLMPLLRLRHLAYCLLLFSLIGFLISLFPAAAHGDDTPIVVRNPRKLRVHTLPAERIQVGEADDYKPSIALLPNGQILMTAFHAVTLPDGGYREDTLLFRSNDGGKSWSAGEKLDLLGREPYLTVLKSGVVFITGHLLHRDIRNKDKLVRGYIHRSVDGGKTWETTEVGPEGFPPGRWTHSTRNILELPDRTLLAGTDADGLIPDLDAADSATTDSQCFSGPFYMWRSNDQGKTWDKSPISMPVGFQSIWGFFGGEAFLWRARSGKIIAFVRVNSRELPIAGRPIKPRDDSDDHIVLYTSTDQGRTFHRLADFGDYGELYPSVLRLRDGRLLLTFTNRNIDRRPLGVHAVLGTEHRDGFAFDLEHDRLLLDWKTPDDKTTGGGFGPTVQLKNGILVTAYSYRGADNKTYLEIVRWRAP